MEQIVNALPSIIAGALLASIVYHIALPFLG